MHGVTSSADLPAMSGALTRFCGKNERSAIDRKSGFDGRRGGIVFARENESTICAICATVGSVAEASFFQL